MGTMVVCANGKERQFRRKATPDLAKPSKVRRVASVIDRVLARVQHVSAVAPMRILEDARAPMPRGNVRHGQAAVARTLPPVKLDNLREAQVRNQIGDMTGNNDCRSRSTNAQIILHDGA